MVRGRSMEEKRSTDRIGWYNIDSRVRFRDTRSCP